ncbi:mediator complex subunit 6 [Leptinotarsa decemlineata]|uniref:mediator complex subunit 6 n=1 Tax=Leptinotarsa decemlineata TaxID=7539 RepID=UPI000C2543AA|nr:mediator of RNA polymerase II transcription subunit 6 [Leptinotarsa decemlineata]XP_023016302.1 mediator of RNA polymerase II transcription subunit 6 [Leptinotarsa decemlineata]
MMAGRLAMSAPGIPDNPLSLSWHDSAWIPILNTANVLDYFSQGSNPFFDRTCNNEIVKMQRLNPEQLQNMTGLEYILLHVQEPILYVIRKQHRHSPQQVTPLADYYIIAGVVYQAPDLASVLNSRLLSAVHHLQSSFEESSSFAKYHPSKGYSWDFKSQRANVEKTKKDEKPREEPSSLFQRQRVDMLLGELIRKFPLPTPPQPAKASAVSTKQESENGGSENKEIKTEIKQEKIKPPPEKKPRLH